MHSSLWALLWFRYKMFPVSLIIRGGARLEGASHQGCDLAGVFLPQALLFSLYFLATMW